MTPGGWRAVRCDLPSRSPLHPAVDKYGQHGSLAPSTPPLPRPDDAQALVRGVSWALLLAAPFWYALFDFLT